MHHQIKEIMTSLSTDLKSSISEELLQSGLPILPKLKLQILQNRGVDCLILDAHDIHKLFSYYGEVVSVSVSFQEATVLFKELVPAYFAQKTLNEKYIEVLNAKLSVSWLAVPPESKNLHRITSEVSRDSGEVPENSFKYTCKYAIEVENSAEFQVSRKIIGPKGRHMKSIIETCCGDRDREECRGNVVKLRLRGRGSGFREGPFNEESCEPLHLCVSSKFYDKFRLACNEAEKLIRQVYAEYYAFMRKRGIECVSLDIKIIQ